VNTCQQCSKPFAARRRHAKYCRGACRMAACRTRQRSGTVSPVPAEHQAISLLRFLLSETRAFGLDGQRIGQWCLSCTGNHFPAPSRPRATPCPCCCHQARQFLATVEV
jgi:hypothetical protein